MFREYVNVWRAKGLTVVPWTVNKMDDKKYFHNSLGIPVMTDSTAEWKSFSSDYGIHTVSADNIGNFVIATWLFTA